MTVAWKKVFGSLMIVLAVIGILLGAFVVSQVWHYRQPVIGGLQEVLDHTSAVLQTTDDGLAVIDQVVSSVYTSTLYLDDATTALGKTMQSATNFMDSAGTFVGGDLITTITNTQSALASAQASAAVIDNVLTSISSVPLLGLQYNPQTPLNKALGKVSSSLDPVQKSLQSFQNNLDSTQANMQELTNQISSLNQQITTINTNLVQAKATIHDYRSGINSLQGSIARARAKVGLWVTTLAWMITILILILVMILVGTLLQGIMMLLPEKPIQDVPPNQA